MKRIASFIFGIIISLSAFGQLKIEGDWDSYIYSQNTHGLYHLIGSYAGWDDQGIYIAGYNNSNLSSIATKRVYVGKSIVFDLMNNYLGIGTSNPSVALEVLKGGNIVSTPENNLTAKFSDSNGWSGIGIYGKKECGSFIHLGYVGNAKAVELVTSQNFFLIKTNGISRLYVGGNGNVGIGKKYDTAIKLDVAGTIRAEEILVEDIAATNMNLSGDIAANNITIKTNGQTADFVFEHDYQLKDLSEVEAFIKTNKHLENIPSATEMEEKGVNLAEMNKLLLQKVEELTLHTIAQEKKLKAQENKLKEFDVLKSEMESIKSLLLNTNL